jgi:Protein of unknown function (DUF3105)
MSSRREQKEALRRERERREAEAKAAQQRKRMVGIGGAVLIGAVALVLIVVVAAGGGDGGGEGVRGDGDTFPSGGSVAEQKVFDVQQAATAAGCELESNPARSRDHTQSPDQEVPYRQNPPTSGRHFAVPAEDGLYNGTPPGDTELVHALEHGRVIIWAKPSLPLEARETIRAIFDNDSFQLLVVSRPNMPYPVAATAWNADPEPLGTGRTLACPEWNADVPDALRTFMDEHRSNGPEPIP